MGLIVIFVARILDSGCFIDEECESGLKLDNLGLLTYKPFNL